MRFDAAAVDARQLRLRPDTGTGFDAELVKAEDEVRWEVADVDWVAEGDDSRFVWDEFVLRRFKDVGS